MCFVRIVRMCVWFVKVSEMARNVWWFTCLEKEGRKGCLFCQGKWRVVPALAKKVRSCASTVKENEMWLLWQENLNGAPTLTRNVISSPVEARNWEEVSAWRRKRRCNCFNISSEKAYVLQQGQWNGVPVQTMKLSCTCLSNISPQMHLL